ncbi:sialidase family protein [Actinopolymorpha alba]|uniref:sialidase family protein n=1 Tax=Actinopolymorpha alba TaxID=533267 RepID=UPI00038211EC|nr:sialidase family protein [Actinopolymorpha alba]
MKDERFNGIVTASEEDPGVRTALLPVLYEPDSHAANLVELDNGDLLCVWFNGPGEGEPGTNVVLSRLRQGTDRWTEPVLLASDPDRSEQNPVLAKGPDGRLWFLHTSNTPNNQKTARVVVRFSDDNGETWTQPEILFKEPGIFLRNPPLLLDDGSWLLPCYYCRPTGERSVVKISEDQGRSWQEYAVPDAEYKVQMSVAARCSFRPPRASPVGPTPDRGDGTLLAVFRSRRADRIYASESADLGRTWTPPVRTGLPNNNSAVQLTALRSGRLALIYNDASLERDQFRWVGSAESPRKKAVRTPLTLALSEDGGRTWPYHRNVQMADLEYRENEMGYSYPCVIQTADGRLQIAFSYLRKTIKHVSLTEDWIVEGTR